MDNLQVVYINKNLKWELHLKNILRKFEQHFNIVSKIYIITSQSKPLKPFLFCNRWHFGFYKILENFRVENFLIPPHRGRGSKNICSSNCFGIANLAVLIKLNYLYGYFSITYLWPHMKAAFSNLNQKVCLKWTFKIPARIWQCI